jgi:hypothetical protein
MKPISPSEEEVESLITAGTNSLSDYYEVYANRFVPELKFQSDAYYSTNYFLTASDNFPIEPPFMVKANIDAFPMLHSNYVSSFLKKYFNLDAEFAWSEYGWRNQVPWHTDYYDNLKDEFTDPLILPLSSDWTFQIKSKSGTIHSLKVEKYRPFIFDGSLLHTVPLNNKNPAKFISLRFFGNYQTFVEHYKNNL